MGKLTIYREGETGFTAVSNSFIDYYMADANDAQLKVYLHLLRAFQANQDPGISEMADLFNHTEKDIVRALKYWEKKSLLALDYDTGKNVSAIRLLTPAPQNSESARPEPAVAADMPVLPPVSQTPPPETIPEKPAYSLDDLKMFRSNEETEQLLFIVEQYIGKPLSATEVRTILFIYDKLGFSADLIDYLVQYCVGKEKKSFRYIEKVAVECLSDYESTGKKHFSDSERSHLYHPVDQGMGLFSRRYRNRLRTDRPGSGQASFCICRQHTGKLVSVSGTQRRGYPGY